MKEMIAEIQLKVTESFETIEQQSKLKLYSLENIARKATETVLTISQQMPMMPKNILTYYMRSLSSILWI
jgi:hypothetical protein